jgi:hypothetical protein
VVGGLAVAALLPLAGCMPAGPPAQSALERKLSSIGAYVKERQGVLKAGGVKSSVLAKDDAGRCYVIVAGGGPAGNAPELTVQTGPAPVPARQLNVENPSAWDFCLATGVGAELTLTPRGGSASQGAFTVYSVDPDIHQRNYPGVQRPKVAVGAEGGSEQLTEVHEQGQGGQGGQAGGPGPTGAAPVLVVESPVGDAQAAVQALVKGPVTRLLFARRSACAFVDKEADKQAPTCPEADQLVGGEPLVAVVPGAAGRVEMQPNQLVLVVASDGSRMYVRAREVEAGKPAKIQLPEKARAWRHRPEAAMGDILAAALAVKPGRDEVAAAVECEGRARTRFHKDMADVDAARDGADDYTLKAIKKRTIQLKTGLDKSIQKCFKKVQGGVAKRRALIREAGDMLLGLVRGRLGSGA